MDLILTVEDHLNLKQEVKRALESFNFTYPNKVMHLCLVRSLGVVKFFTSSYTYQNEATFLVSFRLIHNSKYKYTYLDNPANVFNYEPEVDKYLNFRASFDSAIASCSPEFDFPIYRSDPRIKVDGKVVGVNEDLRF